MILGFILIPLERTLLLDEILLYLYYLYASLYAGKWIDRDQVKPLYVNDGI